QNPNWYAYIISTATSLGFNPNPSFSLYDTLGFAAVLYGAFLWCMWSVELLGEVKGADKLRNTWMMLSGATLAQFLILIVGMAWAVDYMGPGFIRSLGYLTLFQPTAVPTFSFRGVY